MGGHPMGGHPMGGQMGGHPMGGHPMGTGFVPYVPPSEDAKTPSKTPPKTTEEGWNAWVGGKLSAQQDLFVMAFVIYAMQFVDVYTTLKLDKVRFLNRVPTIAAVSTTVACVFAYVGLKRALR